MNKADLWQYESRGTEAGRKVICGVDEAGRGPLAGPVCAAAVVLPRDLDLESALPGLDDSKRLTDKKRRELDKAICSVASAWSIALSSEQEIDEINILQATFLAMRRAVEGLAVQPDFILVDGNRAPDFGIPAQTIVGGDGLSASIAAASILAKVYRDDWMIRMDGQYPQYGFAVHKGYGTRRHYAALEELGPCPLHRRSFLKKFYAGRS